MSCVVSSTRSFFVNTDNQAAKFFRSSEGQDKTMKFLADGVFPLVTEIARLSGASEAEMGNLATAHSAVKLTRDVTGTLNVFRGVIPGLVVKGQLVGGLAQGIYHDTPVNLKTPKPVRITSPQNMRATWHGGSVDVDVRPRGGTLPHGRYTLEATTPLRHNDVAVSQTEKWLKLGETTFHMAGGLCYTAGFGLARPAANARKHFDVEFGDAGNGIADSFQPIMCANHVSGIFKNSFALAYEFEAYDRAMRSGEYDPEQVDKDFMSKIIDSAIELIEKILEILNDVLYFTRTAAPPAVRIPLGLGISGLGLVRVWRRTA